MTATTNNIDYIAAKGWLKDGERSLLFELASQLPGNAVVLNIGCEYGASIACLRAGNATAHIIGLDLDMSKMVSDYGCELIEADSHKLIQTWRQPLDLIFVDGDHGELGVSLDAKFADFLPVGGWILFQDVFDWDKPGEIHGVCPGVYAAVEKWFLTAKQEFEELPSVDTTRVFRRVKAHEQPARVADSGSSSADLRTAGSVGKDDRVLKAEPKISRVNKGANRG